MTDPIFPYFGGKRRAAHLVWDALGPVDRYIEPFFGSGAVLLGSPHRPKSELVNDKDHHVANLWRALQSDPDEVWRVASAPCSEVELRARVKWLRGWVAPDFGDLTACDAFAAGVWLWCASTSIGARKGMFRDQLHRSDHGHGIKALEFQHWRDVVDRMARVQVLCGDWTRCVTPAALWTAACVTGVFLDPPYGEGTDVPYEDRTGDTAAEVWTWAVKAGRNPRLRIVVAGYEDGRELPEGWTAIERAEKGGFSNASGSNANRHRERLWLSPHCQRSGQVGLFDGAG
jgi:DNA adenine methylase